MYKHKISIKSWVAMLLLVPLFGISGAQAQDASTSEPSAVPKPPADSAREICSTLYRFGSVKFSFDQKSQNQIADPGNKLNFSGTVKNENSYPLPDGEILVRILRQDDKVAQENWHPIISDHKIKGVDLKANEESKFTFDWTVPAFAPAGLYRVEFFYQGAGRYSIAGLPFVANATGGSLLFTVKSAGIEKYLNFDRSSVLLNKKPLTLRSVPPTLSKDKPVTVDAKLMLSSVTKEETRVKVTKKLYDWSDADLKEPLQTQEETITLKPGKALPLNFQWDTPRDGVYQLQLSATTDNPQVLPSVIKVRFPIGGDSPRLVYSGIGKFDSDGSAEIITCALNGTFGESNGKISTAVKKTDGVIVEKEEIIPQSGKIATVLKVTQEQIKDGFSVSAKAFNGGGLETDSHTITYTPEILGFATATKQDVSPKSDTSQKSVYLLIISMVVLIGASIATYFVIAKRKAKINKEWETL